MIHDFPTSASTWPQVLEDKNARKDWGWDPQYTLEKMVPYMLHKVKTQLQSEQVIKDLF